MITDFFMQKLNSYLLIAEHFPSVLSAYAATSIVSFLFFAAVFLLLRSHTPIFFAQQRPENDNQTLQTTKDDGGLMFLWLLFAFWASYQYVVRGNEYIDYAITALLFLFFGQIYAILTAFLAARKIGYGSLALAVAKSLAAMFSLITTVVLLAYSETYWQRIPPEFKIMDFAEFAKFVIHNVSDNEAALRYTIEQSLGIVTRFVLILTVIAVTIYHILIRFPDFCLRHPRLTKNLAGFNSASSIAVAFTLSLMSNELMQGRFYNDVNVLFELLGKALFTA